MILVVDDVEEVRDAIEKLLRADGYDIETVRSEERAVESALRRPPRLILVNLGITRDELVTLAARIRARAQLSERVPVVLFCVDWLHPGEEVELHDNIHATQPDNFNQLRSFVARLLRASSLSHSALTTR